MIERKDFFSKKKGCGKKIPVKKASFTRNTNHLNKFLPGLSMSKSLLLWDFWGVFL
jgi:hypothetical protein